MSDKTPPDHEARQRAVSEFDVNFLVEAGAGSGKTTLMAQRVVGLIATGYAADTIAAVTFTRKAAAELRERIQIVLEKASLNPALANDVFIGTIHSFCARLLRERPVEAGLDPRFRELEEDEAVLLADHWWNGWLERLHLAGDAQLERIRELGVSPHSLRDAFKEFVRYPDVDFSAADAPLPEFTELAQQLAALVAEGLAVIPSEAPDAGWDDVQSMLFGLRFDQRLKGWSKPADFFASLAEVSTSQKPTQNRWVRNPATAKEDKAAAKEYGERLLEWRNAVAKDALNAWYEHRYAPVELLLRRASREFSDHRVATGRLTFEDLLLRAAMLLRTDRGARRALGERWRRVLVDEFQDTDPIQAEVLFLLGSEPPVEGAGDQHWSAVTLRSGALFVVGDPKQSIYRFRRADVETYEEARTAIQNQGALLRLTANFRSLPAIATFVNAHFGGEEGVFPAVPSPYQAAFAPLEPMKEATEGTPPGGVVLRYAIHGAAGEANKDHLIEADSERVASWIATEISAGNIKARDVLILTRKKEGLASHARALAARGVPVSVAGAKVPLEAELHELQLLLQLMHDPTNTVFVAAVLEGRFFGASPADLWAAQKSGIAFTIARPPITVEMNERAVRVHDALQTLHTWFLRSRSDAPDVFLSRVLDETGLLVLTAASELGDVRAGLLVRFIEEVREASLDPERAGTAAQHALERLLKAEIPDAPLLPGREDAVRVMNLHKAKGLEAEIVILAVPTDAKGRSQKVAVRRKESRPTGGVLIEGTEGNKTTVIAQPVGWEEMQATEQAFQDAEGERLRYVAATRARSRLIIGEFHKETKAGWDRQDNRQWSSFSPTLDALSAGVLELAVTSATGREKMPETAADVLKRVALVEAARAQASAPTWKWQTVSQSAKGQSAEVRNLENVSSEGRSAGAAWGRAVHRVLEEIGRRADGVPSQLLATRIAEEESIPQRATELFDIITKVTQTEIWKALMAAPARRFEWPVAGWSNTKEGRVYTEGVIDAAFQTPAGWRVLDWKTDDVTDDAWALRVPAYTRQVDRYAELLGQATGESVSGELVRVR
ncbi:MAG: UvrD-helicase domain-containing protein [Gemmatimonadetes bacterium]|nr:UvrD-helicase domain-containing protein [Gemmatimonadota bacterium]